MWHILDGVNGNQVSPGTVNNKVDSRVSKYISEKLLHLLLV